jgi:hypothetical protein
MPTTHAYVHTDPDFVYKIFCNSNVNQRSGLSIEPRGSHVLNHIVVALIDALDTLCNLTTHIFREGSRGPVVQWSSGPVVQWSSGPVVQGSSGPGVQWSRGPVVQGPGSRVDIQKTVVTYSIVSYYVQKSSVSKFVCSIACT